MKTYPSISGKVKLAIGNHVFGFFKYDGSNIRAEWSKKAGFYKFGSRRQLLSESQGTIFTSKELFLNKYGPELDKIFRQRGYDRAIAYFEFFGPNSKYGFHSDDDTHDVVLFDVAPYKRGMLSPRDFLDIFGHLDIPEVLFWGFLTDSDVQAVRNGLLGSAEGIVFKWAHKKQTQMIKIKTRDWLDGLKTFCEGDPKLFERLK